MAKKKILVVEDSPTQLKMTVAALQDQRYSILTAMDGEEALRKIFADNPDLVVLDVIMPGQDGFAFANEVAKDEKLADIPIVLVFF